MGYCLRKYATMIFNRKRLNILLFLIAVLLSGIAIWLYRLPYPGPQTEYYSETKAAEGKDSLLTKSATDALLTTVPSPYDSITATPSGESVSNTLPPQTDILRSSGFNDVDPRKMIADHPFRSEALKIINNHLEESDSVSRRRILSYCEHLRTSYTTKDIDFIRQVFSDNALIIVGNVVKTGKKWDGTDATKVSYALRSKNSYLSRLDEVFKANKKIGMTFSDFHIMRHPSIKGIYGVSLRQKYSTDKYSDDGYLFLLWDFRNPSMPLIHVRTWQPHRVVAEGEDIINISDFNFD